MHSYANAAGTVGVAFGDVAETSSARERTLAQALSGAAELVVVVIVEV